MSGKVQKIIRTANCLKPDLLFKYDALGRRVSKTQIPKNVVDADTITTYYVHDARGNVMAVYNEKRYPDGTVDLALVEQHLYGSSRLGMRQVNDLLVEKGVEKEVDLAYSARVLGEKAFELTNHLGNVMAVVSDKKLANNEPDVKSVTDYYPFGMTMTGRSFNGTSYRFGFNGGENINEISGKNTYVDLGERGIDVRLGRLNWRTDPKAAEYPWQSTYAYYMNSPIWQIDYKGEGDSDSGGVPAKEQKDGTWTTAQSSTYTPSPVKEIPKPMPATPQPSPMGEIRDLNKVEWQRRHNQLMADPIGKSIVSDPFLRATATAGLTVTLPAMASSLAPAATTTAINTFNTVKTATSITLNTAARAYFTNPQTVELIGGAAFGFGMNSLTPTIPDMPQLSITPMFDYGNAVGTTGRTFFNLIKEKQQSTIRTEETDETQP